MTKDFDPHRLDVRRFAEEGAELSVDDKLPRFRRLFAETEGADASAREGHWGARGEMPGGPRGESHTPRHVHPDIWVHLEADVSLPMVCQRCLNPVDVPLEVSR